MHAAHNFNAIMHLTIVSAILWPDVYSVIAETFSHTHTHTHTGLCAVIMAATDHTSHVCWFKTQRLDNSCVLLISSRPHLVPPPPHTHTPPSIRGPPRPEDAAAPGGLAPPHGPGTRRLGPGLNEIAAKLWRLVRAEVRLAEVEEEEVLVEVEEEEAFSMACKQCNFMWVCSNKRIGTDRMDTSDGGVMVWGDDQWVAHHGFVFRVYVCVCVWWWWGGYP